MGALLVLATEEVMAAAEHLSFREWCVHLDHLCQVRLLRSLTQMPAITEYQMHTAWGEGTTPEEFYEVDIIHEKTHLIQSDTGQTKVIK
jgi:hypothetical protein